VAILVAWGVVRAFGLERGFPMVPLIAYTPLVGGAAVLVALIAGVLRFWAAAAAAGAVAVLLAALVLPRAFPADQSGLPSDGPELRVMTANLFLGRADPGSVVELVRAQDVDLLSLQELTPKEVHALRDAGLDRLLPEHALFAAPRSAGAGLFSRWSLGHVSLIPSSGERLAMPQVRLRIPDAADVEVVDVHPPPPTGSQQVSDWEQGLRSLPSADPRGPVRILLGDFNATLDHQALRDVLGRGYADAADAVGKALTPTWPRGHLLPPTVTIDHVLVDDRVRVGDVGIHDLTGSDHRSVTADLVTPANRRFGADAPGTSRGP
jgi:endonuclease/exonuclease/phosphatase family metal-dependent hydrolase